MGTEFDRLGICQEAQLWAGLVQIFAEGNATKISTCTLKYENVFNRFKLRCLMRWNKISSKAAIFGQDIWFPISQHESMSSDLERSRKSSSVLSRAEIHLWRAKSLQYVVHAKLSFVKWISGAFRGHVQRNPVSCWRLAETRDLDRRILGKVGSSEDNRGIYGRLAPLIGMFNRYPVRTLE